MARTLLNVPKTAQRGEVVEIRALMDGGTVIYEEPLY